MGRFSMVAAGACILAVGGAFALYRIELTVGRMKAGGAAQKPSWCEQHGAWRTDILRLCLLAQPFSTSRGLQASFVTRRRPSH